MHMKNSSKPYQTGVAANFINEKLAGGFASFSLDELIAKTGLSVIAAKNQLLRLGDRVTRVSPRHQYFLIITPEHRSFGAPPVDWWLGDYMLWLGHPYYLGLQSAAMTFGSSQQAIQETQVMTDIPRREIIIGRIRIRFFMKTGIEKSLVQQLPGAYAPLKVSTPETTSFDLVRYAHYLGGIERAAETILTMLPSLKAKAFKQVLDAEREITTAQRFGYILEAMGAASLAQEVRDWLPAKLPNILLSVHVDGDKLATANPTWCVINNAGYSL